MIYIKKAGVMMLGVLMTAIMAGCGTVETGFSHDGRIPVVASFEATKEITEAIGGNKNGRHSETAGSQIVCVQRAGNGAMGRPGYPGGR